ncbi:MAG: hypothetical protein L6R28_23090 [Planctomycetes bacterium]|nr:hypothetical protein [Planctomycetota bacterium]
MSTHADLEVDDVIAWIWMLILALKPAASGWTFTIIQFSIEDPENSWSAWVRGIEVFMYQYLAAFVLFMLSAICLVAALTFLK